MNFFVVAQKTVVETGISQNTEMSKTKTIKRKVAIGRFSNETQYAKGLFYDKKNDPMGKQALDLLSTKLMQSEKFILLERSDMNKIKEELANGGIKSNNISADYLIFGSITQFGRKTTGRQGLFSSSKSQIVEATVSIRLVDVSTGLIIYSDEAKGLAKTKSKTTLGLGGKQGYDATLSDKAISAAINQLVGNIINKCTDKPWRSYFLSAEEDGLIISGGKSQGLEVGDTFTVVRKGKKVKNPQNGLFIELPGKNVAKVKVIMTAGQNAETEYSIVEIVEGSFDKENLSNYYITENK
ncbi:penicillin-binding protein activator LpoB [Marinilabiliaceae bacterium JC040]|nr:penicillin-binding protein activator LpoB [Marinilabiliaceae bacterium JC040]